jgi:hypothetical protein
MPVFNQTRTVDITPTITAGAYSAGDVIGGLLAFDVYSAGGGGTIRRVLMIDADDEKAAGRLYLFSAAPTTIADNAPFAPSAADLRKLIDVITIAGNEYATVNSRAYVVKRDLGIDYASADGRVYAYWVCDSAVTYGTTGDLTLRLTAWED